MDLRSGKQRETGKERETSDGSGDPASSPSRPRQPRLGGERQAWLLCLSPSCLSSLRLGGEIWLEWRDFDLSLSLRLCPPRFPSVLSAPPPCISSIFVTALWFWAFISFPPPVCQAVSLSLSLCPSMILYRASFSDLCFPTMRPFRRLILKS